MTTLHMTPAEFRQIRKDLNLTQAQLAEKLGVHPITISHYETGARKISYAVAIAVQTFRPLVKCQWCGTNGEHYCPHDVAVG